MTRIRRGILLSLTCSAFHCLSPPLQAHSADASPTLEWVRQFGTVTDDWSYGVSADGLGNVYTTGLTYGDLAGINAGERDAYLAKYTASGALVWSRQFGTSSYDIGNAITADGLGNVYVSGVTGGDLGGPLVGYGDAFVSKFSDVGSLLWTRQLGTTQWDTSYGMAADRLGNIYISGYTWGSLEGVNAGDGDAFLSKYDESGALLWTRQPGSSVYDISNEMTVDNAGNVYMAGVIGDFAGGNGGDKDALLITYDASGSLIWSKQFGTTGDDEISGISSDGAGHVYVTGWTTGGLAGTNAGQRDVFIGKYDAVGDVLWTRQFGTAMLDVSRGISADENGNAYVTGLTTGVLGDSRVGGSDVFVAKFNASGALVWTEQLGTTSWDEGYSVSTDSLGNIYVSGNTQGGFQGANAGGIDAFVVQLNDPVPEPSAPLLGATATIFAIVKRRYR